MQAYATPGAYFEWTDPPLQSIQGLRTDIAGFAGAAVRGPLLKPQRVESWSQFTSTFGGHMAQSYLAYAVSGFFANGGRRCWVVRVADKDAARSAKFSLTGPGDTPVVTLQASSPGTWAHQLRVQIISTGESFTLILGLPDGGTQEIWRNLTAQATSARVATLVASRDPSTRAKALKAIWKESIAGRLNDEVNGSKLVTVCLRPGLSEDPTDEQPDHYLLAPGPVTSIRRPEELPEPGLGADGLASLSLDHWLEALDALSAVDEVSILAIPDVFAGGVAVEPPLDEEVGCTDLIRAPNATLVDARPAAERMARLPDSDPDGKDLADALQRAMVAQCDVRKDRVALLDTPSFHTEPETVIRRYQAVDSPFAALYFPWIRVPDPLQLGGLLRTVPPSGHIAGVLARTDLEVGVYKPPANAVIEGAEDVAVTLDDITHGVLNDDGVNVLRPYPGRGIRIAGARTRAPRTSEWRYLNVRRLVSMIEESINEQTQWSVFEPNNPDLWRDIDRAARGFLDDLWRRGWLDGATAEQAYSVQCDAATNPSTERDLGRITCQIGLQPPWPAEFVVVRIGRTGYGTEILERSRNSG